MYNSKFWSFLHIQKTDGSAVSICVPFLPYAWCFQIMMQYCYSRRWEIGEVEQGLWHVLMVTLCVSARYHKFPAHTNLSFRRCLVKRKVRWMQKVDKLHISADKGSGEREKSTAGPRAWICLTWLMIPAEGGSYMSSAFKSLKSLKGLLVFFGPWPFPLGGH